ncbi:MAG: hypothetical protein HQ547_03395 [Candidatus Omnitrophica bacterium]|nr:hypothetical protein [Candidatus Omnitrophota bacterium]
MPGLFGVIGENPQGWFLGAEQRLNHYNYKIDRYIDERFCIGRLHKGTLFPNNQPVWDEEKKTAVFVDGYIVIDDNISDSLENSGRTLRKILSLYKEKGDRFVSDIKTGIFNIVIIDLRNMVVKLINDRMGFSPLYIRNSPTNKLFFSPEESVLCETEGSRNKIDWTGISESLYYGYPLRGRTFLKEVRLQGSGSVLTYSLKDGKLDDRQYFDFNYNDGEKQDRWDEIVKEKFFLLGKRYNSDSRRYGMFLSGGVDSRLILATWPKREKLHAYTWGAKGLSDLEIGKKIAQRVKIKHTMLPFDGNTFLNNWEETFRLQSNVFYWYMTEYAKAVEKDGIDIVIDGLMGDVFLGGDFFIKKSPRDILFPYRTKPNNLSLREMAELIDRESRIFKNRNIADLLDNESRKEINNAQEERMHDIEQDISGIYHSADCREKIIEKFRIENIGRRFVNFQRVGLSYRVAAIHPFYDYELLDLVSAMPISLRANHKIYYKIWQTLGGISSIRYARNIISPSLPFPVQESCIYLYVIKMRLRAQLYRLTKGRFCHKDDFYDFDRWFRSDPRLNKLVKRGFLNNPDLFDTSEMKKFIDKSSTYEEDNLRQAAPLLLSYLFFMKKNSGKDFREAVKDESTIN